MQNGSSLLTISGLKKSFNTGKQNEVNVLHGINFKMQAGDFYALMGPSGCGKSTLLNIVGGLIKPSGGDVVLSGRNLKDLNDGKLTKIRANEVGWIFQSFGLIDNLTALENVMIPMNLVGTDDSVAGERALGLLQAVGLVGRDHHFPDDLSGGQRQRVAIARALANEPKLLLADEPTGNLDTQTGIGIIKLFQKLAQQDKKAILMVTHDVNLAHASDKVWILREGIIKEEREGDEI